VRVDVTIRCVSMDNADPFVALGNVCTMLGIFLLLVPRLSSASCVWQLVQDNCQKEFQATSLDRRVVSRHHLLCLFGLRSIEEKMSIHAQHRS
jgi:hypothetical protein